MPSSSANNDIIASSSYTMTTSDGIEIRGLSFAERLELSETTGCIILDDENSNELGWPSNKVRTTKYTLLSFPFRAFGMQFNRAGNVYFTIIVILMFLGRYSNLFDSPVAPWGQLVMLIVVFLLNIMSEGFDDLSRFKHDACTNGQPCLVLEKDYEGFASRKWGELTRGMIVKIKRGEMVPADLLILVTSHTLVDPCCYTETSNLDGETYLKRKLVIPELVGSCLDKEGESKEEKGNEFEPLNIDPKIIIENLSGTNVYYEHANANLTRFDGYMELPNKRDGDASKQIHFCGENVLLRGSVICNVDWVIGVVLFTGIETKMLLANNPSGVKQSAIDRFTNRIVVFLILTMGALVLISVLLSFYGPWVPPHDLWYLLYTPEQTGFVAPPWLASTLAFVVLYKNIMPILLYGIVELIAQVHQKFISYDLNLYDEEMNRSAECNSTNLVHDIGQVQWIFSDKTGTLTRNDMRFVGCSTPDGKLFGQCESNSLSREYNQLHNNDLRLFTQAVFRKQMVEKDEKQTDPSFEKLLKVLSLCHTVLVENEYADTNDQDNDSGVVKNEKKDPTVRIRRAYESSSTAVETGDNNDNNQKLVVNDTLQKNDILPKYSAESPDEEAIVSGVNFLGYEFIGTEGKNLVCLRMGNIIEKWNVLAVNSFSSNRKRMSVVYREPHGEKRIILVCKGADSEMLKIAANGQEEIDTIKEQVTQFAEEGFRTLVVGQRVLGEDEFNTWIQEFDSSCETKRLSSKTETNLIDTIASKVEKDLEILGVTCIEDRLQEQVTETISFIKQAGIKFWVITGDKIETAMNIGYSVELLTKSTNIMYLTEEILLSGGGESLQTYLGGLLDEISATSSASHALILEGTVLDNILENDTFRNLFLSIISSCQVVISCRTSPSQKGELVRLVQTNVYPTPITLAIGDGANDVPMIQTANVGVGISGKEGTHARDVADFSLPKFKYLLPLLFIHGRTGYLRIGKAVALIFYANVMFTLTAFWYQAISMFSGASIFDDLIYTTWNIFVAASSVSIGLFDRDFLPKEKVMQHPDAYKLGKNNQLLSIGYIGVEMARGVVHGLLASVLIASYDDVDLQEGVFFLCLITVLTLRTIWNASSVSIFIIICVFFNIILGIILVYFVNLRTFEPVSVIRPSVWTLIGTVASFLLAFDVATHFFYMIFSPLSHHKKNQSKQSIYSPIDAV